MIHAHAPILSTQLPSDSERRVSVRYQRDPETVCRLGLASGYESRWARVRDVSATGVGLRLSGPLEPGRELTVEFTESHLSLRWALQARVIHATAQGDGTWLVGCRFANPLTADELRCLLALPNRQEETSPSAPGVLVADDDPPVRALLGYVLSQRGFTVREAGGGSEAVAALRRYQGAIRLALLDLRMPEQDGLATLEALKQLDPDLRCCVICSEPSMEDWLKEAGVGCVLRKPFLLRDVARCLETLQKTPG
jgi:CheY-like chemotaxis protein